MSQRVAVWAKKRQVRKSIVLPVSVDVFNLDGNAPGYFVALVPAATCATFSDFGDEIPANNPVVRDDSVSTGFDF